MAFGENVNLQLANPSKSFTLCEKSHGVGNSVPWPAGAIGPLSNLWSGFSTLNTLGSCGAETWRWISGDGWNWSMAKKTLNSCNKKMQQKYDSAYWAWLLWLQWLGFVYGDALLDALISYAYICIKLPSWEIFGTFSNHPQSQIIVYLWRIHHMVHSQGTLRYWSFTHFIAIPIGHCKYDGFARAFASTSSQEGVFVWGHEKSSWLAAGQRWFFRQPKRSILMVWGCGKSLVK